MSKRIVRVPEDSIGDVYSYSMIEYHTDITEKINQLLKIKKIPYKLTSQSYGGTDTTDDWRVLFELKKVDL
tara:strand:- start:111 stop:323 length:213 start_codon:yes stop_codon:yes gene_type:complete